MSKAGTKMIKGAKQALQYVRCEHEWERSVTSVRANMVVGQVDYCAKCGSRRTQTTKPSTVLE